jgi:hypothetical protein
MTSIRKDEWRMVRKQELGNNCIPACISLFGDNNTSQHQTSSAGVEVGKKPWPSVDPSLAEQCWHRHSISTASGQ